MACEVVLISTMHVRVRFSPLFTICDGKISMWMLLMVKAKCQEKEGRHTCYLRNNIVLVILLVLSYPAQHSV